MSLLACSSFDQSGSYFASAITALDTHKIRVQSTNSSSLLATAFALDKSHKATCISWASYTKGRSDNKKRKLNDIENAIIAIGQNKGSILLYSPLQNEVILKLDNPYSASISDFHISKERSSGWSVDVSQNVVEWDLINGTTKNKFKFNETVNRISIIEYQGKAHLLLAAHSIHLVDIQTREAIKTFPGHISLIHTVFPINSTSFITAAQGDRFINIYSLDSAPVVLVAQSNVLSVSYANETVSAVTEDGIVEVFQNVLTKTNTKRKGAPSKQSNATIKLQRQEGTQLTIEGSFVEDSQITITWLEEGLIPYFERIGLEGLKDEYIVNKSKPVIQAKDHSLFGQDIATAKRYNESNATVTAGDNLRFLDNKEAQDEEFEYRVEDGPSLAEKLESMKVESSLPKKKQGRVTTGSLAVVLTQALRSNDHTLLETVLSNRDETVLKNTIERLDTNLAVTLLERLAERIARQTNRQGQLNIWVKWVLVIHGGVLINIPNLSKSLSSLHSTLNRRANTLPRLLQLQGKLDILYAEQEIQNANKDVAEDEYNDDDEDSDVEYFEELDGGDLIDDAEQDFYEEDEEGFMSVDESSDEEEQQEVVDDLEDEEMDQEDGYSDKEVHGNKLQVESESEDEQEQLKKRIAKLKSKQDKRRGK
jgi:U3 small nucleolar RNA-associated protein 5